MMSVMPVAIFVARRELILPVFHLVVGTVVMTAANLVVVGLAAKCQSLKSLGRKKNVVV